MIAFYFFNFFIAYFIGLAKVEQLLLQIFSIATLKKNDLLTYKVMTHIFFILTEMKIHYL